MYKLISRASNRDQACKAIQQLVVSPKFRSLPSTNFVRCASQLYPTTSQRWDDAMTQAESIVGDSSNFSNLQRWVSGEFNNITKYLQRLVGTNHPMLETAKRCSYISEGKMGSAQARGLTVILTAKAIESLSQYSMVGGQSGEQKQKELIKNQISLAEMTEMTYSAYMIHRGVMDLKMHGLEEVSSQSSASALPPFGITSTTVAAKDKDNDYDNEAEQILIAKQAKGLHYGNKVSVLVGDFLLAYVMRGLGNLFSSKAVDLVASAITNFMEGEFLLIDDWRSKNYLLSEESRDLARWQRRSFATIGSLQGNTCQATLVLANIQGKLQVDAREFGKNLGLAWQAHTELQPFLNLIYEPIELPEMPAYPAYDLNCLPVLLFMRDAYGRKNFRLMLDEIKGLAIDGSSAEMGHSGNSKSSILINQHRHQEPVDYRRLHEMILNQERAIEESYKMIRDYSQQAIKHLESFPPSPARDVLSNICESLFKK